MARERDTKGAVLVVVLLAALAVLAVLVATGCNGRQVVSGDFATSERPVVRSLHWYSVAELVETIGSAFFGSRPPTALEYERALNMLEVEGGAKPDAPKTNEATKTNAAKALKELDK